jgi:hypothetical protein
MEFQPSKLSASGQDLGGSILFPLRLGFSGTPSSLLPLEMGQCRFATGTEAKVTFGFLAIKGLFLIDFICCPTT